MTDDVLVHGEDPTPIRGVAFVEATGPTTLAIRWDDGGSDRVDLAGWIAKHDIVALRDAAAFATVEVVEDGDAVRWSSDDELSIDAHHLALIAEQQRVFAAADIAAWQERLGLSNNEAADLLGVRPSTWFAYKAGESRIPGGVRIACRAIERDPLIFEALYRPRRNGRPPVAA